jgi:hypothetical protein
MKLTTNRQQFQKFITPKISNQRSGGLGNVEEQAQKERAAFSRLALERKTYPYLMVHNK